ncbi:MAG TPA: WG repeat-containing protein, partial [Candidatus Melainabacteria bacterium]|nr:WG repeat-containing protein [Candidatus Melainabacteria bacterium]
MNRLLKSVLLTFCSLATVACTTPPKVLTEKEPFDPHNKWGFVDATGKVVIEPKYESVKPFSEGLAAVVQDRRWGYIDKTGKVAIEPKYDVVTPFSDGMAAVSTNGKWGYIDKTGKLVIPLDYDGAKEFSEGFAGVKEGNYWSYISKENKKIAEGYKDIGKFSCGLGAFKTDAGW